MSDIPNRPRLRLRLAHTRRFRAVSNRYPRRVAEAYSGDLERAASDSDAQVAETVAKWERQQGLTALTVQDWRAIGHAEGRASVDPATITTMVKAVSEATEADIIARLTDSAPPRPSTQHAPLQQQGLPATSKGGA